MDNNIKKVTELAVGAEVGNIYYRYNELKDDFDTYRIVSIQNRETVSCIINGDKTQRRKFQLKELRANYTQLISNAIMTISKVLAATTENGIPIYDTLIMVYKREDTETTFSVPDILCRQAISDIFYQPYCDMKENPMVGFSVTHDTLPAEYSINDLIWVDDVLESEVINLYKNDSLDTIISLIKSKEYDKLLEDLLRQHCKSITLPSVWEDIRNNPLPDQMHGYCKNVKTLLITNNFMYDFYQMFGITKVSFEIVYRNNGKECALPLNQREMLQEIYQINMEKTIVLDFDFSIDLSEVKVPYVLVMDNTDTLYFIGFTRTKDEYVKVYDTTVIDSMNEINKKLSNAVDFYQKYSE